ncbi:capsid cement protein [Caenimonas terrae]|uniref:Capsid cement protein n=1 Tax=Caenimonas terrae TaxID=696074 RepID=A0ABW0NDX1_9BURK
MKTFIQLGDTLDLDPGAKVATGTGFLFGAALFGVAVVDAVAGTKSAFQCEGVVSIAKTAALAISVGDRLFWDPVNKCVNKTVAAQQQVGICVVAALAADATVAMLLESALPVAT